MSPIYEYGCSDRRHPRKTVEHKMMEEPEYFCSECGGRLHKIPQPFQWGVSPLSLIQAWSERNWSKKLRKEPREEAYDSVATDRGKPQRNFNTRK